MNIFTKVLIKVIKGYKYLISPLFGHSCRYLPTCSEYFIDSLNEYGVTDFYYEVLFFLILLNFQFSQVLSYFCLKTQFCTQEPKETDLLRD